jgi:hypothetical protein
MKCQSFPLMQVTAMVCSAHQYNFRDGPNLIAGF